MLEQCLGLRDKARGCHFALLGRGMGRDLRSPGIVTRFPLSLSNSGIAFNTYIFKLWSHLHVYADASANNVMC